MWYKKAAAQGETIAQHVLEELELGEDSGSVSLSVEPSVATE